MVIFFCYFNIFWLYLNISKYIWASFGYFGIFWAIFENVHLGTLPGQQLKPTYTKMGEYEKLRHADETCFLQADCLPYFNS